MAYQTLQTFLEKTERNVLNLQEAKAAGRKVIGQYCIYFPLELALAAGAIPVSLCGTKNDTIPTAETVLPRTLCPLIKSSFGFALQDSCPYLAASDLVVGEATCDGKKKMYELLADYKPVMLMQLPQIQDEYAQKNWCREYTLLIDRIEKICGVTISENDIKRAMDLTQRLRKSLKRVFDLAKKNPSPLSGLELLTIAQRTSFMPNYEEAITYLDAIADEIEPLSTENQEKKTRLLITGTPVGIGSHKVVQILEECGASVVCLDNCTCYKKVLLDMEPASDEEKEPLSILAKRYLSMHCAVMSPNPNRYIVLKRLTQEFSADGVVDVTWQGCQTYEIESSGLLKQFVQKQLHLPYLQINTDYSPSDTEQIKVRVEAFLEMVANQRI